MFLVVQWCCHSVYKNQASVVRTLDSAIHQINHYPVDSLIGFPKGGCLHDTRATFVPEWVYSGSLSWLYICLCDTTTKCRARASHPGVSSPQVLYWGKNFTPVWNLTTVSCKHETTTCFSVKSVCWFVMFAILNLTCILSAWSVLSNNGIWNDRVIM